MRRYGRGENVYGIYTAPIYDSENAYIPKANRFVTDVASVASKVTVNNNTGHYNGRAKVTRVTEAESVVNVEGRDFPPQIMAMVLGKIYNEATGMLYDDGSQGDAPYCATSFHRVYETGVKYEQYLKGKWSVEGEESATSKEDIDPKNITLVYTAITTEYQWDLSNAGGAAYDFDSDAFTTLPNGSKRYQKVITKSVPQSEFIANPYGWYGNVQVPSPLAIPGFTLSSSSPADDATGVSADAPITFNVSNGLSKVGFILLDESNYAVAGTLSWADDAKSFSFAPAEDMVSAAVYTAVYDCIDVYGQKLQGAVSFTIA